MQAPNASLEIQPEGPIQVEPTLSPEDAHRLKQVIKESEALKESGKAIAEESLKQFVEGEVAKSLGDSYKVRK